MKWFKHDTDCDESEGLSYLIDTEGFAGYGRWWRLLEIVASKMDKTDRCHVEYPAKKWCSLLGLKQKKLILFLEVTQNKLKTKVVCSENIIRIEMPNLLKKRDEYSQKSGQSSDNVGPKKKEERNKNTDKRIKKEDRGFTPPTIEEVKAYCLERKNSVNPDKWHAHYSANGWKVGKNPMKDWKAAVRTWEANDKEKGTPNNGTGSGSNQTGTPEPGKYAGKETVI